MDTRSGRARSPMKARYTKCDSSDHGDGSLNTSSKRSFCSKTSNELTVDKLTNRPVRPFMPLSCTFTDLHFAARDLRETCHLSWASPPLSLARHCRSFLVFLTLQLRQLLRVAALVQQVVLRGVRLVQLLACGRTRDGSVCQPTMLMYTMRVPALHLAYQWCETLG